jgi:hypothetical protein
LSIAFDDVAFNRTAAYGVDASSAQQNGMAACQPLLKFKLGHYPKSRKASAASTAVITTTATAPMTQARHPVMTMVFPVNHDHRMISVFRVARFADSDRVSVIELDEHELITAP